jgi:hypothetical protein
LAALAVARSGPVQPLRRVCESFGEPSQWNQRGWAPTVLAPARDTAVVLGLFAIERSALECPQQDTPLLTNLIRCAKTGKAEKVMRVSVDQAIWLTQAGMGACLCGAFSVSPL